MGRKNSVAMASIQRMCRIQQVDEKALANKSKMLLTIYRDVCWSTIGRADCVREDLVCYCGGQLDTALIYLETFAPTEERERFETTVRNLFETKWMVELVDTAMLKVKEFPYNGDLYFEIISKCYLNSFRYTEVEMLELLQIERSTFYDRKKEAIMAFGLSMWGGAIPKLKTFLKDTGDALQALPWEVIDNEEDDEEAEASGLY